MTHLSTKYNRPIQNHIKQILYTLLTSTLLLTVCVNAGKAQVELLVSPVLKEKNSPVITLNGEANVTLTEGDVYEELGASATDAVDGK